MPPSAASDQGLHCLLTDVSMENAVKMKTSIARWSGGAMVLGKRPVPGHPNNLG